jgi:hypothetical protein
MPVSADEVRGAYRFILGREPESEAVVRFHEHKANVEALRADLFASKEFWNLGVLRNSRVWALLHRRRRSRPSEPVEPIAPLDAQTDAIKVAADGRDEGLDEGSPKTTAWLRRM